MNSFLETLRQLGPSRLGMMGAIVLGLLVFFVFVSLRVSAPSMRLLYADLSPADSAAVAAKLEESQIKYEVAQDGGRITVPENDVGRARLLLASVGLPNGGSMGYEIFDEQSGFGTTNFVQNINQVRALEGELARTISSLQNIQTARVHLVLPQRELFSRQSNPSTASVFVGMRPGAALEKGQINAIRSLVASAVPNLKVSDVALIDSNGNLLAKGNEEDINASSMKAEEMRLGYESRLTEKVEDQVSRIVGFGNVRASVTAEMNFDRISTNEELYDPEGQVVRSSQVTQETGKEQSASGGDVSVENNLPGVGADLLSGGGPTAENNKTEEVTNFEISKTLRNTVREVGEIKKLSVAILVDGRYAEDAEGKKTYEPRSQEELDQISALVKSAVGFDEKRGDTIEVVNMQFVKEVVSDEFVDDRLLFGFEKTKLLDIAEMLTIAIMLILVIMLILQPMINRLMAVSAQAASEDMGRTDMLAPRSSSPALIGASSPGDDFSGADAGGGREESLIDIQGVEGKVKASSIKKVAEIVENYPNETVSVLRSWMTQEN